MESHIIASFPLEKPRCKSCQIQIDVFLFLSMSISPKKWITLSWLIAIPLLLWEFCTRDHILFRYQNLLSFYYQLCVKTSKRKELFKVQIWCSAVKSRWKFIMYPVLHVWFSALCSFNTRLFPYFAKKFSRLWKSPGSHGMHSPQQLIYKPDENGKHWSQQHLYFSLALLLLDLTIKCMKCSEKAIWMTKRISVPTKLLLLRQIIEL